MTVDEAVAGRLLEALNPEDVALALAAADEVSDRRSRRNRATELQVERARYEAERAERAFDACEPENRLVARSLEARWEERLVALAEAEKALVATQATVPPLPSRPELEALTGDVASLWHAPTTSPRDRKRLLRTLIADVTLLPEPDFSKARIGIRWHTGAADEVAVARLQAVTEYRRTDRGAVEMARRLADLTNAQVAERLNAAGYKTGAGRSFDRMAVANMRHYHKLPQPGLLEQGELTAAEVARRLGIRHGSVVYWVARGWLPARRGLNDQWCIPFGPEVETACRERVARSPHVHEPDSAEPKAANELSIGELASVLGISTNVVYYWVERHYVEARRAPGGRLFVKFNQDVETACQARVTASVHLPLRKEAVDGH